MTYLNFQTKKKAYSTWWNVLIITWLNILRYRDRIFGCLHQPYRRSVIPNQTFSFEAKHRLPSTLTSIISVDHNKYSPRDLFSKLFYLNTIKFKWLARLVLYIRDINFRHSRNALIVQSHQQEVISFFRPLPKLNAIYRLMMATKIYFLRIVYIDTRGSG